MSCSAIDVILKGLEELQKKEGNLMSILSEGQIQYLIVYFRFMRIFIKWSPKIIDLGYIRAFYYSLENVIPFAETLLLNPVGSDVDHLVGILFEKIQSLKGGIHYFCTHYFENHQNKPMIDEDVGRREFIMVELLGPLQENLKHLCSIDVWNQQLRKLEEKLRFLTPFLKILENEERKMKNLLIRVQVLVENAVIVSFLCLLEDVYDEMHLKGKLFDLLLKFKHVEPEIRMNYLEALKASDTVLSGTVQIHVQAVLAVDSLLYDLEEMLSVVPTHGDHVEILSKELRFLKDFLMDAQLKEYMEPEMLTPFLIRVETMVRESGSVIRSVCASQSEHVMTEEKNLSLYDLLKNINLIKDEIGQIYLKVPKPSLSNFPKTQKFGFVDLFLQNLDELLTHRADSIALVKNEIGTIKSELVSVRTYLRNTLKNCKDVEAVQDIEHRLTRVAYEVECIIDLITACSGPIWYYQLWLSDVTREIMLLKAVDTAIDVKKDFDTSVQTLEMASNYRSSPYNTSVDEEMVGFNDQEEILKDQLQRGTNHLDVVSIIGMPGLGKTTLANKLYEDPSITAHFHVRSWCCVSQAYERRSLLVGILDHGIIELNAFVRKMSEDDLAEVLYKNLKGRKYLIVLDDIWNIEAWNDLRSCFPDDHNGSRIMLTSRVQDVALLVKPGRSPHHLRLFTEEESWQLLQKKVFQQETCPPELSLVGNQIAKHCKGLPLSVVVVAGLLRETDRNEDRWRKIAETLGKHIIGEQGKGMATLELSYNYLPDHLKACFLYLGIFPEDKEIPVQKLTSLWIAEGFVSKTDVKCLEDEAEGYLMDLIGRSLVIVAKNRCKGGVKACLIHDLLRDFCLAKAKQENFLWLLHGNEENFTCSDGLYSNFDSYSFNALSPQQHRMCIYSQREKFFEWRPSYPHVRSLLFFAIGRSRRLTYIYPIDFSFISYGLKILRVLDLWNISMGKEFPAGIELLVHLRYLALRGEIHSVPSLIGNLQKLETLLVKGLVGEIVLPVTVCKMASLRHLRIDDRCAFESPCNRYENSIHLDNLRSLGTPALKFGDKLSEYILRSSSCLRKLRCIFLESLDFSSGCNRFPVLDFLSELESLKVLYHGKMQYPCEFSFPSNLKKLTLSKFRLPWCEITKIGRLPKLEALKLLSRAFEGPIWDVGDEEFLNLKYLKIDTLDFSQWNASSDHFPQLQQLVLHGCKKLEVIPDSLGEIPTLNMIEVRWCSDSTANSVRQIHEEQQDMGNDGLKVLIHPPVTDFTSTS